MCKGTVSPVDGEKQSVGLLAGTPASTVRMDCAIPWTEPEVLLCCNTKSSGG